MAEAPMRWSDVLADPCLQDLPYKIELNADGKIVMSPTGNQHGQMKAKVGSELQARGAGVAWVNGSVQVPDGSVYVADVVWMSDARLAHHGMPDPMTVAPEICVEVVSPSNSKREMARKAAGYLAAGAVEVWIVSLDGERSVHKAPSA